MKYLLDTHTLLWSFGKSDELSNSVKEILANRNNRICVSTVTFWEIAVKISIGKLNLQGKTLNDIIDFCKTQNIEIIQLSAEHTIEYQKVPLKESHKDPFDRMLISICLKDNFIFLTRDTKMPQYKDYGLMILW